MAGSGDDKTLAIEKGEDGKTPGSARFSTVLAVAVLTVIAGGVGALMGTLTAPPAAPAETAAVPEEDGEAAETAEAPASETTARLASAENLAVLPLEPIITNLYAPANIWLRMEASLIVDADAVKDGEVLAAQVEADTLAFLRTVQLAQIEGARGLLHLSEDLYQRALLRSDAVVDYVIHGLVAE